MKKRSLQHIIFWVVIFFYTFYTITGEDESPIFALILASELMLVMISITYLHFYLITNFFEKKNYISYIISSSLSYIICLFGFQSYFSHYYNYKNDYVQTAVSLFFILFITTSLKLFRKIYYQKIKIREIENKQLKTELNLLKNQINPHFLFNTLNTLYSYSLENSEKLPNMIIQLSDLMRYLLKSNNEDQVELVDEISFIDNYIELEKSRLGSSYKINFKKTGDFTNKFVVPMLIIPLVENCFKHGLNKNKEKGFINIYIATSGNFIDIITENCNNGVTSDSNGFGIDNLRKRLDLTYSGNYNLDIIESKNTFRTELKIIL